MSLDGTGTLPGITVRRRKGRHEIAADKTIAAARRNELIPAGHLDDILLASIRALARQLDIAEADAKPHATAVITRELREMLAAARLDPASRAGAPHDKFGALIEALTVDDS